MTVTEQLAADAALVEQALNEALPEPAPALPAAVAELRRAMRYSLLQGGKRIRASLALAFCRLNGGEAAAAAPFACALEMLHAYSLIHDDLPCMDDDDLRRGKPSCHVAFGEAVALLAGDALQTAAFETALAAPALPSAARCEGALVLARCAGGLGMCGGQAMDLNAEGRTVPAEELRDIQRRKTGALMAAAAQMGVVAAGGGKEDLEAAFGYADGIGCVFQMIDDILDVTANEAELGKPVGSDEKSQKTTYVSLFGIEATRAMAEERNQAAKACLAPYGERAAYLLQLADWLYNRRH